MLRVLLASISIVTASLCSVSSSYPCVPWPASTYRPLPPDPRDFQFVLRVKIISLVYPIKYKDHLGRITDVDVDAGPGSVALALVTEGLKGYRTGDRIQIAQVSHNYSCNIPYKVGDEGYVASNMLLEVNGLPTVFIQQ